MILSFFPPLTASDFFPPSLPTVLPVASTNQPPSALLSSYLLSFYINTQDAPPLHPLKPHLAVKMRKRDSAQVPTRLRLSTSGATAEKALLSDEGSLRQQSRLSCTPGLVKALGGAGGELMEAEPWKNLAAKLLQTFAKQVHTTAFWSLKPG